MQRLTVEKEKHGFKRVYIASCQDGCIYKAFCEEAGCNCTEVSAIIARLAKIEDIISDENGEYDLDLIAELVKAKRDGQCVILPCKIGGKLYSAFPLCGVNSHQIRKFEINKDGMFACSALMIPFSDVGKTVFLTREAAEQALKEYKDGQKNS